MVEKQTYPLRSPELAILHKQLGDLVHYGVVTVLQLLVLPNALGHAEQQTFFALAINILASRGFL